MNGINRGNRDSALEIERGEPTLIKMYFKASVRKKSERGEFKSSVVTGSLKVTYQPIGIDSKFDTCSRPVGREQALTACFGDGGGARYSFISSSTPHPGSTMAVSLVSAGSAG